MTLQPEAEDEADSAREQTVRNRLLYYTGMMHFQKLKK